MKLFLASGENILYYLFLLEYFWQSKMKVVALIHILHQYYRKSVTSFFAAYDALCEEGTASPVCQALDEVADISVPGEVYLRTVPLFVKQKLVDLM